MKKSVSLFRKYYRPLVGAALVTSSLFNIALPVLAQTAGGLNISNTATATYEDDQGETFEATSNTVSIKVAEVAGIEVTPEGVTDNNGGSVNTNDILFYDFLVTNTGNDPTRVFVPDSSNINVTNGTIESVRIVELNGSTLTTPVGVNSNSGNVEPGGYTTDNSLTPNGSLAPGENFKVRVEVQVTTSNATSPISVRFGNTSPNDNSPETQNQPSSGTAKDIRTVDNADGSVAGETNGAPVNGEREAAAFLKTNLSTEITPLALITVLNEEKTVNTNDPATVTDDTITYRLNLRVEDSSPNGAFNAADLVGTDITLDNATQNRILVSEAIPKNTTLDTSFDPTKNLPTGWTAVYTTSDLNTDPLSANWKTYDPANLPTANEVTRIGFVYDGTLAKGSTTESVPNAFEYKVVTDGLPASGGSIFSIAQAFGQTADGNTDIIYDESGDQNPNNFSDDSQPPNESGTAYDPNQDDGVANYATDGRDPNNNNTGTGPDGEVNVVKIGSGGATSGILNGPNGQAGAVGPDGDNNDFTNKSTPNVGNSQGNFNPDAITYTNSVQNPSSNVSRIDNVTLLPLRPSEASNATGDNVYGVNTDIPNNTKVTITNTDGSQKAVYNYTNTNGFVLVSNESSGLNSGATAVSLGSLAIGAVKNYSVAIDLPSTSQLKEVSIPIVAFSENQVGSGFDPASNSVFNITIDRLYTGYLKLVKDARILRADGSQVQGFSQTPSAIKPGQIIEYRITYSNISTPANGSGNVILNAANIAIDEDGRIDFKDDDTLNNSGNNWALDNDNNDGDGEVNTNIDTSHVIGKTVTSRGTLTYYSASNNAIGERSGPNAGGDVSRYTVDIENLAPQKSGTFTFQRKVN